MYVTEDPNVTKIKNEDPNAAKMRAIEFFHFGCYWLILMGVAVAALGYWDQVDLKPIWTGLVMVGFISGMLSGWLQKTWKLWRV